MFFNVFCENWHAALDLQVDDDGRTTTDGRDGRAEDDDDGTDDGQTEDRTEDDDDGRTKDSKFKICSKYDFKPFIWMKMI